MGKRCHNLKRNLQNLSWSLSRLVMFSISLSCLQIPNVFKAHHNRAEQTIKVLLKVHSTVLKFILSLFSHLLWEQAVSFQWQGMGKKSCPEEWHSWKRPNNHQEDFCSIILLWWHRICEHQKHVVKVHLVVHIISGLSSGKRNCTRGRQQFHVSKPHGWSWWQSLKSEAMILGQLWHRQQPSFSSVGEILIKALIISVFLYFLDCPCWDFNSWHYSFSGCWRLLPVPQTALFWLIHVWRSYIITVDISVENTESQACDYRSHYSISLWGLSAFLKENVIKNLASLQRIGILISWLLAIRASSLCWYICF